MARRTENAGQTGLALAAGAAAKVVRAIAARHTRRGLKCFRDFMESFELGEEVAARACV